MNKQKILIVFGTRPEAIKMAPVVKEFKKNSDVFETKVCVTAQHREMLDQVLDFFEITPDYDLDIMESNQNLSLLTSGILGGVTKVLEDFRPDFMYVQGDTTTSFAASLSAYYSGVKVCHVEAGLRTFDKWAPFPEEINRQLTGKLADYHFAPTQHTKEHLLSENVDETTILVTGNTVIDALLYSAEKVDSKEQSEFRKLDSLIEPGKKLILVTGHRRENFGEGLNNICNALRRLAGEEDVQIIYPVHLNPNVQKPVYDLLGNIKNITLIEPLEYESFVWLMKRSYLMITDSGGIQEEAPSLGKPVLVTREKTERPEAIDAGTVVLVGTNEERIVQECLLLVNNVEQYKSMSLRHNPYGDGNAAGKIVEFQRGLV